MSDLYIEARLQAIKDIASASCTDKKDADNIANFCDEIYSAIPKLDKIVEELELHSFELGTDALPIHYVRLNEAIEIVKQGSASDDTDNVCKWYKVNGNACKCYTHAEIYDSRVIDWCVCPYCGRKIRLVD